MNKSVLMMLLFLVISAAPAFSDEASHREAALELIEVINTRAILEQMLDAIEASLERNLMSRELTMERQETAEKIQAELMTWFEAFFTWERMQDLYIDVYVDVFSESEIRELTDFYRSPLGMKLIQKTPELLEKTMARTQAELQQRLPELQQKLMDRISELEEEYE